MRKRLFLVTVGVLFLLTISRGQQEERERVLGYFLSQGQKTLEQYEAIRYLETSGSLEARMRVETSFNNKTLIHRIVKEEGSGFIRKTVLRKILNEEISLEKNDPGKIAFSSQNYTFTPTEERESGFWKLSISPKRKGEFLIKGVLFVDSSGILVRSKGRLTKNPSFWVHDVDTEIAYKQIHGIRLPVYLKSTGKIRFFGSSPILEVWYHYKSVNGMRVVEFE